MAWEAVVGDEVAACYGSLVQSWGSGAMMIWRSDLDLRLE